MDPSRWDRIQEVFGDAMDREPAERAIFLDEACAGDDALRKEVESLIAASDGAADLVENAVLDAADSFVPTREALPSGYRIGPYEVLEEIGRGGMGRVYLAVRADDQYRKQVAIKIMRGGGEDPELLARFRTERQILANLNHPFIARLLDGGTTEKGQAYVVMEHIDGEPIDKYCDRLRLPVAKRLKLFTKVSSAVQYAHANLVVHRDLKPANILVTKDGNPKLLDFGIAKLLDPTQSPHTLAVTGTAARLLTPEYASPEQVRGEPITTATDVYSLGVVLYELLTGQRPFGLASSHQHELERVICEQDPRRPSTATTGERPDTAKEASRARSTELDGLRRLLEGDLDSIILKALRKEPAHRYSSPDEMAQDIGRHLKGLPVLARLGTWRYRTGKFVRRNRVGVAASVLVFLVVAGGLIGTRYGFLEAQREARAARRVADFLVELFRESDPRIAQGRMVTAREILDRGAERVTEGLHDDPEIRTRLELALGEIYLSLGMYSEGYPFLERAATQMAEQIGPDHADSLRAAKAHGRALYLLQRSDEALALLSTTLERARAQFGEDDPRTMSIMSHLGMAHRATGNYKDAEQILTRALEAQRRVLGPEHVETLAAMNDLATVYQVNRRLDQAEELLVNAVEISQRVMGDEHPTTLIALGNLARLHEQRGDYQEAERRMRQVVQRSGRTLGEDHPHTLILSNSLGIILARQERLVEAEAMWVDTLERQRRALPPGHVEMMRTLGNIGFIYLNTERYSEAEPLFREALAALLVSHGEDDPQTLKTAANLATAIWLQGRHEEAEEDYLDALTRTRRALGDEDPETLRAMGTLGFLYSEAGRDADADRWYGEMLRILRESREEVDAYTADIIYRVARLAAVQGDNDRALEHLRMAIDSGYSRPDILEEPDLKSLHGSPEFERLVAGIREEAGSAGP